MDWYISPTLDIGLKARNIVLAYTTYMYISKVKNMVSGEEWQADKKVQEIRKATPNESRFLEQFYSSRNVVHLDCYA